MSIDRAPFCSYLGVRSREKGLQVKQSIDELLSDGKSVRHAGGSAHVLPTSTLDLGDMPKVRCWAKEFQTHSDRLDILICTAAIVPGVFTLAQNPQHEMAYVTNHLGHFFLCSELYPLLKSTAEKDRATAAAGNQPTEASGLAESRIVVVSADVTTFMDTLRLNKGRQWCMNLDRIDDRRAFSRTEAYGRTKLCNVLFTRRLAQLTENNKHLVKVNTLHPGVFASEIFWVDSHSRPADQQPSWFERTMKSAMQSASNLIAMKPHEQALTTLFAATSHEITQNNWHGEFFYPYGYVKTHDLVSLAKDDDAAHELWTKCIQQVKEGLQGSNGDTTNVFFESLA